MISLRSHAISLAAVFLALAIGVMLGSGLLSNTLLSGLRDDKHELQNQINGLTDEKNALNQKLSAAGEFDAQMSPRMVRDALAGKSVRTVESLGSVDQPGPLQKAFIDEQAAQCGYCIAGMIVRAQALLEAVNAITEKQGWRW